jgi:3'-5' exonuclease
MISSGKAHKPAVYLDIETQITDDCATMLAIGDKRALRTAVVRIPRDARLKAAEKIAADDAAKAAREIEELAAFNAAQQAAALDDLRKTALSASAGGRIFSISFAVDDGEIVALDSRTAGEAAMLEDLFRGLSPVTIDEHRGARFMKSGLPPLERPTVVAHFAQFDIDFIWMRARILNVPVPAWWPKNVPSYASEKVFDTMAAWAGVRDRISLNALCKLLGLPGKSWVDGGGVQDLLDAGRGDEVISYNVDDVRRLRSVHRRIIGLRPLASDIIGLGGVPEEEPAPVALVEVAGSPQIDPYACMRSGPGAGMFIDETELADERDL